MAAEHKTKLNFLYTDFCPFAQRTWIALLEKEENPNAPVLFTPALVSLINKTPEFLAVNPAGEVPSGVHEGKNVFESLQFNEYVEEAFPTKPLLPSDAHGRWWARVLIARHENVKTEYYSTLFGAEEGKEANVKKYLATLAKFSKDIRGPYALGEKFSLVDAAFFPFVERARVCLGHFLKFEIPATEEFAKLRAWYDAVAARPSVRITTAARTDESMRTFPYESRARDAYLTEVYEAYYFSQLGYAREVLKTAKPGVRALNVEELRRRKADDARAKKEAALAEARKLVASAL